MNSFHKQQGASMPSVILFVGMAMILITIAFKLYPAFYENWQISHVVEGFDKEPDLANLSVDEIRTRFDKRLDTNSVRDFNREEGLEITIQDSMLSIKVDYEVRVNIYKNIDAIVTFTDSLEKRL